MGFSSRPPPPRVSLIRTGQRVEICSEGEVLGRIVTRRRRAGGGGRRWLAAEEINSQPAFTVGGSGGRERDAERGRERCRQRPHPDPFGDGLPWETLSICGRKDARRPYGV